MLSVMFLAVLLGRSAISMRNLAVAAIIVLVIAPQAVLTPSFQMSFMAVMGLIAGYELLGDWQGRLRHGLAARPLLPERSGIWSAAADRAVFHHDHCQCVHDPAGRLSFQPVCGLVAACKRAGHADRNLSGDAGRCGKCLPDACSGWNTGLCR